MSNNIPHRMRRLRSNKTIRLMVQENHLMKCDLIYPMFVREDITFTHAIEAMPGISQYPLSAFSEALDELVQAGVSALLLFGLPAHKDELGSSAWAENGIVQQAVRLAKQRYPELYVITDVCLCAYTSHGHCGVVQEGHIINDASVELLAKVAVSHAQAGADMVAPSDMMDGRVAALRSALDSAGFINVPIMSYAAKYASSFYGPFREAASSAPAFGDRKTYQMNPANADEALREVALDVEEEADVLLVKPAMAYGDILYRVKQSTHLPLAAYAVSGEYSMIKAAAERGFIDEKQVVLESLLGMKRAGADLLITYHALDVARWLEA